MVQPGMVYISSPTELGTVYSKSELQALSEVCQEFVIPLYLDGARLGYGLQSPGNDVTLEDIDRLTDVFYIGFKLNAEEASFCEHRAILLNHAPEIGV